jgi:hypothetical protein
VSFVWAPILTADEPFFCEHFSNLLTFTHFHSRE